MTDDPIERLAARVSRPLGVALLALVMTWILLVVRAPEDAVQGVVQKILTLSKGRAVTTLYVAAAITEAQTVTMTDVAATGLTLAAAATVNVNA